MNKDEFDSGRKIGLFKATINSYGDRILEGNPSLKKFQMVTSEKSTLKTGELHMARREMDRFKEMGSVADSLKAQARSELSSAENTMKNLFSLIREANTKTKEQKDEIEKLKKSRRRGEQALAVGILENYKHAEVLRELEIVKRELSMLRLDIAAVSEEKSQNEKQTEALSLKILSNISTMDTIKKEIEEVNEEQVLVELARIEALKEYREIEAQREKEANQFSLEIEKTWEKLKDIIEMIDQSKELESKLAATLTDIDVLENELRLVKEMDKKVRRNESLRCSDASFQREEDLDTSLLLKSISKELEEAKKELDSVREEGFQYMTSMDIVRNELKHVTAEISQLKKIEEKSDLTVKNLNSKLLRAKSKLEVAFAAEEKARSIVFNLSLTLKQLKTEAEVANKDRDLIVKEAETIKAEIQDTESKIDLTEEQLQATMQELEAVKSLEASALENLKSLTENTMRSRACATKNNNSSITISKFEYEYLIGHADGAKETADKKVAAAQAWVEAIKASEKENLIKLDLAQREITKLRMEEEQEAFRIARSNSAKRTVEGELQNWRRKREKNSLPENMRLSFPRKSMKLNANLTPSRRGNSNLTPSRIGNGSVTPSSKTNGNTTPSKRAKFRKSASPAARHITIKKRTKLNVNRAKVKILKKPNMDISEDTNSNAREIHVERRGVSRYKEARKARDSLITQNAKKTMKDLSPLQLRSSKSKAKAQIQEIETPKKSRPSEEQIMSSEDMDDYQYAKVVRELEVVKKELGMLKLDMAVVLEKKLKAEKPIKKENGNEIEEQKPLQLAKIETLKDQTDSVEEDEREKKAHQISSKIEQTKKKLKDVLVDLEHTRELEFDTRSDSLEGMVAKYQRQEDLERELEAAKKELALVKEEGFQYLSSMDVIRSELKHVLAEISKLKRIEEKSDSTVEDLNSKLLQAKSKLEVVSLTAEKAKSIKTNLSLTLEHLKAEAENAKKEKELLVKESVDMEGEIQNTQFQTRYIEGRLQAAMEELESVKSSEALVMENLYSLIENTKKARAYEPQNSSSITISEFEYEYLTGCSTRAEEIANKKVAASQAWIEAIKASEKDILIKIDLAQRKIRENRLKEEREAYRTKRSSSGKRMVIDEDQVLSRRQKWEKNATTLPRKPKKRNENLTPTTLKGIGNDNLTPSNKLSLTYENQAEPSPSFRLCTSKWQGSLSF